MKTWQRRTGWVLVWATATGLGAAWLAHQQLQKQRDIFDTNARIAHRLLSQRMVQHDAMLGTLTLLQPPLSAGSATGSTSGIRITTAIDSLSRLYPQVQGVARRGAHGSSSWPSGWPAQLSAAEQRSAASGHAELADTDWGRGELYLVQSAQPASYALKLDLRAVIPTEDWPLPAATSPVRAWLTQGARSFVIQPGAAHASQPGWTWESSKTLDSPSQPLVLHLRQKLDVRALPWLPMVAWGLFCLLALVALHAALRQREQRQRAEQLLRLGQVARLNTLGELAAGLAHELNQPLTAILSSSQAARRLLGDSDYEAADRAMLQSADQAKRASAVVGRLRRLVERPDISDNTQAVSLPQAVSEALHLLAPELERRNVQTQVQVQVANGTQLPAAQAEPVALQQILHNLLTNALQAMEATPSGRRRLQVTLARAGSHVMLSVQDSGPGIAPDMRARLFTPFATSRAQGLGLGLTLSESLAESMGGSLTLSNPTPTRTTGACFVLTLPAHAAQPHTTPATPPASAADASPHSTAVPPAPSPLPPSAQSGAA